MRVRETTRTTTATKKQTTKKSDVGKGCAHIDEDVRCGPFSLVRIDSGSTLY